jgi:hypothetical protein
VLTDAVRFAVPLEGKEMSLVFITIRHCTRPSLAATQSVWLGIVHEKATSIACASHLPAASPPGASVQLGAMDRGSSPGWRRRLVQWMLAIGIMSAAGCTSPLVRRSVEGDSVWNPSAPPGGTGLIDRRLGATSSTVPASGPVTESYVVQRDQLYVHTNFYLPPTHGLLAELVGLKQRVLDAVDMPASNESIHVYLFRSPRELAAFSSQTGDPILKRSAYFIQDATSLRVYASWTYEVERDLRHELTHAYLHSCQYEVPLWLDEGLAEYFEVPANEIGQHSQHLQELSTAMIAGDLDLELTRLAEITDPIELTSQDYGIAWLWVTHLLEEPNANQDLLKLLRLSASSDEAPAAQVTQEIERRWGGAAVRKTLQEKIRATSRFRNLTSWE